MAQKVRSSKIEVEKFYLLPFWWLLGTLTIIKRLEVTRRALKETKPFFILFHHKNQSSGEERMRTRTESAPDISALANKIHIYNPRFPPPKRTKTCAKIP